jgi:hypothetical protein
MRPQLFRLWGLWCGAWWEDGEVRRRSFGPGPEGHRAAAKHAMNKGG